MVSLNDVDLSKVEPKKTFAPIPVGDYLATIAETKREAMQSGNGDKLSLTFVILEAPNGNGEFVGRRLWESLNLWHNNPESSKIAWSEMAAISQACGKATLQDSSELHDTPLIIRVGIKLDMNGEQKNVIRDFKKKTTGVDITPPAVTTESESAKPAYQK